MDRKGQTWRTDGIMTDVVFTVLRSHSPTPARLYWTHDVVFLAHSTASHVVGAESLLEEATANPFDDYLKRVA